MKKMFSKEVKIGIAFIVALFLLYFGINFLKGINIFKPTNSFVVKFDDVTDLSLSTPVLVNGYKVGLVYSMELIENSNNKIAVVINLNKGVKVPVGSKLKLDVSILGSPSMIIEENPNTNSYYSHNDTIQGEKVKGLMESMGKDMVPQVVSLVPKLDSILTGLQTIVNHPALTQSLNNIDEITAELATSSKEFNKLIVSLNKDMPVISKNMVSTTNDLSSMSNKINSMDITQAYNSINTTLKNIESLSNKMNNNNSSLGLLMNDRAMYDSINNTLSNASLLLKDLKDNPSRYINVKVF